MYNGLPQVYLSNQKEESISIQRVKMSFLSVLGTHQSKYCICAHLVSEKSLTLMIMLRDFKAMIAGPRWNMNSVYKSGKLCLVSVKTLTLMIMLR